MCVYFGQVWDNYFDEVPMEKIKSFTSKFQYYNNEYDFAFAVSDRRSAVATALRLFMISSSSPKQAAARLNVSEDKIESILTADRKASGDHVVD